MSRKFRWTFEATFPAGKLEPQYVKVSARPNIDVSKWQIENLKEPQGWQKLVPEGENWEKVRTTFYDTVVDENFVLWKILAECYKLMENKKPDEPLVVPEEMHGEGVLKLWCPKLVHTPPAAPGKTMGIGALGSWYHSNEWDVLEEWTLKKLWPSSVYFGELDYSSSEICTIEVEWCYKEVLYRSNMPTFN